MLGWFKNWNPPVATLFKNAITLESNQSDRMAALGVWSLFGLLGKGLIESQIEHCLNMIQVMKEALQPCHDRISVKNNSWLVAFSPRHSELNSPSWMRYFYLKLKEFNELIGLKILDQGKIMFKCHFLRDAPFVEEPDIHLFIELLLQLIDNVLLFLEQKPVFEKAIQDHPLLEYIKQAETVQETLILGMVRYVPTVLGDKKQYTEAVALDLEKVQKTWCETVLQIQSDYITVDTDKRALIVSMPPNQADIPILLNNLIHAARQCEASSVLQETLANSIRAGIQAALLEMEREKDKKAISAVGQLPVVGGFVKWVAGAETESRPVEGGSRKSNAHAFTFANGFKTQ